MLTRQRIGQIVHTVAAGISKRVYPNLLRHRWRPGYSRWA